MSRPEHKFVIRYRSGHEVTVRANALTITRNSLTGSRSIEWDTMRPRPMLIGVDDVESIWQVK